MHYSYSKKALFFGETDGRKAALVVPSQEILTQFLLFPKKRQILCAGFSIALYP
jgi:hypothetical protein